MITMNDLTVGIGLTAYAAHCTVHSVLTEQDAVIVELDNGAKVRIDMQAIEMFPEQYVLDIVALEVKEDIQVGNVYNLNGTVLIVRSVDTKVCYVVGNNAWQGQYVTVTRAQFLKHIEGAVRVV